MRKFILLYGPNQVPLSPSGVKSNGILFSKEEAEIRINESPDFALIEVLEISSRPVEVITNKRSIV